MLNSGPTLGAGELIHGRYRIERALGQGAFGATYLVRDEERFGVTCALKQLQPQNASIQPKARELFEREARILLAVEHPQIPTLHSYFEESGQYYLAQALVDGDALDSVLKESGPLNEDSVRRIVVEVLGVLKYLHRRNPPLLHRDIKPSNLIRNRDGRISVIDFGAVREALGTTTAANGATMIGTRGYAPKEQAIGFPVPASDLHALGMTALHLLTGRGPGDWYDPLSGERAIVGRTGASSEFEAFLAKMVADLPHRFGSAEEAVAALLGDATRIDGLSTADRTAVDAVSVGADSGHVAEPRPGRGRWPLRGVATAGLVAAVVLLGILKVVRGRDIDTPPTSEQARVDGTPAVATVSEPLDRETTLATQSGLELSVRHPSSWRIVTSGEEGHIGLRDIATSGVFITGLDASREPVLEFARLWAVRLSHKYGRIDLSDTGTFDTAGSFWRFRIELRRATVPERGLLIVEEPPSSQSGTPYRWWAILGQTDANVPTALAMANSLGTRALPSR